MFAVKKFMLKNWANKTSDSTLSATYEETTMGIYKETTWQMCMQTNMTESFSEIHCLIRQNPEMALIILFCLWLIIMYFPVSNNQSHHKGEN